MFLVVVASVIAVVIAASRPRDGGRATGWGWFTAWAGAGLPTAFAAVTGLSIGLFVLPLALAALWSVASRARLWPEALGLLAGVAMMCLVVAGLQRTSVACPSAGALSSPPSCGGPDPGPWLAVGVAFAAAGAVGYAAARRQDDRPHQSSP